MPITLVLILSTATFVSMKGSRVLLTLFAVDLGAGPLGTGLLFALYGLVPFLLVISAGRIADRFDNRVLMYWGLGGFTASLAIDGFSHPATFLFLALFTAGCGVLLVAKRGMLPDSPRDTETQSPRSCSAWAWAAASRCR